MFKNNANATMNVYQGYFKTLQANVFTNSGTLNFIGDSNDTKNCFNPTYIKVHTMDNFEEAYDQNIVKHQHDVHSLLTESIINNQGATLNMDYVYYDSDYSYVAILNNGTASINYSNFETHKQGTDTDAHPFDDDTLVIDSFIINNGTMTSTNTHSVTMAGIVNTGNLTYGGTSNDSNFMDVAVTPAITNTGTLGFYGSITGGNKGIVDTGTTTTSCGITTNEEAYYGTGPGTTILSGGINSRGVNTETYRYKEELVRSCSNSTATKKAIAGKTTDPNYLGYKINNAVVYIADGRSLTANSSGYQFTSDLKNLEHFCGYYTDKYGSRHYSCRQPYNHLTKSGSIESGNNYTVAVLEAYNASASFGEAVNGNESGGGSIATGSNSPSGTYGVYLDHSNFTTYGYIYVQSMFIENDSNNHVTKNLKNNTNSGTGIGTISCSPSSKGINFYGGAITLDPDALCHIEDKEDNFVVYNIGKTGYMYTLDKGVKPITNVTTGVDYVTLQEAINAATAGDTLQITSGVSEPKDEYDVTVNKNITIDLNGNIYDANLIINGGSVTITDADYISDQTNRRGRITNITNNSGTLNVVEGIVDNLTDSSIVNISGGKIKRFTTSGTVSATGGNIDSINNNGSVTLDGATVDGVTNDSNLTVNNSRVSLISNNSHSNLTLGVGANINKLQNYWRWKRKSCSNVFLYCR